MVNNSLSSTEQILAKVLIENGLVQKNIIEKIAIHIQENHYLKLNFSQILLQNNYVNLQDLRLANSIVQNLLSNQNDNLSDPTVGNDISDNPTINDNLNEPIVGNDISDNPTFHDNLNEPIVGNDISDNPTINDNLNEPIVGNDISDNPTFHDNLNEPIVGNDISDNPTLMEKNVTFQSSNQNRSSLGHYTLDQELGRGGMGVVYKATDTRLKRTVALKVILGNSTNKIKIKRFLEEAKAIAQLKHPNIILLYEIVTSPENYFTMEFIEGKSLSQAIIQGIKLKDALTIIYKCANALYFAHKHGIIHRDIKPANIMIDKDNNPKVMDFGLAKNLEDNENLSREGDILGTPAFMSPEQASANQVDARSDIYSLGATMYQALSGRVPFLADNALQILKQIHTEDPIPLRNLNPDVPVDVEAICLKCLEKNPERRYKNAHELATDINNFLNNRPIIAKPPSQLIKFYKFVLRNKISSSFITLTVFFILSFLFYTLIQKNTLQQAHDEVKQAHDEAKQAHDEAIIAKNEAIEEKIREQKARYEGHILLANEFIDNDDPNNARSILDSCIPERRNWEWYLLDNLMDLSMSIPENIKKYNERQTTCMDSRNDVVAFGNEIGEILIYDLSKNKIIKSIRLKDNNFVTNIKFSPKGKYLAASNNKGDVYIWETKKWRGIRKLSYSNNGAASCIFTSDEEKIVVSYNAEHYSENQKIANIIVWGIKTGKQLQAIDYGKKGKNIYDVTLSKDDLMIIAAEESTFFKEKKILTLWNINTGHQKKLKEGIFYHINNISCIGIDKQKRFLVTGSFDYTLIVWDYDNYKPIAQLIGHHDIIRSCSFSDDGKYLASTAEDGNILMWEVTTWKKVANLRGHQKLPRHQQGNKILIFDGVFAKNDKLFISCGEDGIRFWKIDTNTSIVVNKNPRYLPLHEHPIKDCNIHPNKEQMAVALKYGDKIKILDFFGKEIVSSHVKNAFAAINPRRVVFTPNGEALMSAGTGVPVLWGTHNGKPIAEYHGHNSKESFGFCCFSPDGTMLATPSYDNTARIWNVNISLNQDKVNREKALFVLSGHNNSVHACSFHPTKKIIATCGGNTIKLWDIDENKYTTPIMEKELEPIYTQQFPEDTQVLYCAFSPDGKYLLSTSEGHANNLLLWDAEIEKNNNQLKCLGILEAHRTHVNIAVFIPEYKDEQYQFSNRIISASKDNTLKIWNIEDLAAHKADAPKKIAPILSLQGHKGGTNILHFTKNGKIMLSAGEDKQISLWHVGK